MAVKINCYQGKHENYGVQRVFGSFGWGIFTVVAGYLVDTYSQVARSISREHYYENKYPFMPKRVLYCRNIKIFLIFSSKLIKKKFRRHWVAGWTMLQVWASHVPRHTSLPSSLRGEHFRYSLLVHASQPFKSPSFNLYWHWHCLCCLL